MSLVTFKGTRDGITITLGEGSWRVIMSALSAMLNRPNTRTFFRGARVLLETHGRTIAMEQLEELTMLLAQHDMTLISMSGSAQVQTAFALLRTAVRPTEPVAEPPSVPQVVAEILPLVIRKTIRSGQVVQHAGSIIIIGDVNPGAAVIADGDLIVWGKVRGVVHAGAKGDEKAIVGALMLAPTQLRIGHYLAPLSTSTRQLRWPAEVARVKQGQIQVEPWGT